jgi:hypothetical protein
MVRLTHLSINEHARGDGEKLGAIDSEVICAGVDAP